MALRAHLNLTRISIALILFLTLLLPGAFSVFANETDASTNGSNPLLTKTLPVLGNTPDMDRYLSREVSDNYIFGSHSNTPRATAPVVIVSPSPNSTHSPANPGAGIVSTATDGSAESATSGPAKSVTTRATAFVKPTNLEEPANVEEQSTVEPWQPVFADNKSGPGDSVWTHIISSDRLPLSDHERVRFYEDQYQRESLWISKILKRGSPFLAHLVATLDQRFMPLELALLPAIESGYRTTAKSGGNAAGLWQIVPITAKEIGVVRNQWFDGRSDVLVSTTAAIDYLSYLNAEFDGDWELTLAAYNAGPGRVRAAIRKNEKAGLATDYWSLDLPQETLNYVPKLIALVSLLKQPDQGGLEMPDVLMEPAFESIDVGFRVSIDKAAQIADIDIDVLKSLNAGLIHGVTAPKGPHYLLIPAGSGEQFQAAFAGIDRSTVFSEPKTHTVSAGDTISSIALKYGLSQRAVLEMNSLDNAKIRIGQKLAVLDSRNISESIIEYVVTIGDTLSEIADKFSVNVSDIKLSTGESMNDDVIHPGDTLNIIVSTPSSG